MRIYESFNYPEVNVDVAKEMGLTEEEFEKAVEILGRVPNYIELGIFAAMWSEHCSYKSSRIHLKKFPTEAEWVVQGPGENAGIIEIDGDLCACFKVESHNHPSYIEPYQGAATGVGGILRDVFTMGARPIACMDGLRFGNIKDDKSRYIFEGVVSGIAGYGNCFGVPTVGGETFFHDSFKNNPLVNAFALGVVKKDRIFKAKAEGVGNPVIYVGAKTGRDGIHGATMASEEFGEDSEKKRPNVQIGDPFKEKLLLEACLELMKNDFIVGIQDMGAAGLTSSSFEMASRAGSGVELYLDKVPCREEGMTPYEIMLSESQERMLIVAKKGYEDKVLEIFDKWDLDAEIIGKVTDDGYVRLFWKDEQVAELPAKPLGDEAPVYDRPYKEPSYYRELKHDDFAFANLDLDKTFEMMISNPNIASKRWIFEQYDHMVRTNTAVLPGSDATVLRLKGSKKGIVLSMDCNSRYCYLDPYKGGQIAVIEAARNVAMSGGRPLAITDCLNFGNPEKPEVMWQFVKAIEGMSFACEKLNTPVVSGNVSFYNETDGKGIYPTPTVVMVGVIDDVEKRIESHFVGEGNLIYLIGENKGEIGGSEFLSYCLDMDEGVVPEPKIEENIKLINFMIDAVKNELLLSAHDVSLGGLVITLFEMCVKNKIGAQVQFDYKMNDFRYLFSETQGLAFVEVNPAKEEKFLLYANKYGLRTERVGVTGGKEFKVKKGRRVVLLYDLEDLIYQYEREIERWMK
ncbi:phosphoribosylformylglycinamidine synthase subunit PurL [Deferribacter autotrophicus]|uniref:Phosphoribosylformylglycinamidine synthase subunit PurL n=1 Tax=Deferribacter autotrophicus TaxID=500465 RepID=A0A5A8F534_9BACT|nr:phosphoribosylformylglycinamidine synthase subunit PurL [Deferribacter autotrophicus]KAA0256928.1 phosphoribosylformylglycinamidine synthase subunit PurL [Deferribacter autotrophicus]